MAGCLFAFGQQSCRFLVNKCPSMFLPCAGRVDAWRDHLVAKQPEGVIYATGPPASRSGDRIPRVERLGSWVCQGRTIIRLSGSFVFRALLQEERGRRAVFQPSVCLAPRAHRGRKGLMRNFALVLRLAAAGALAAGALAAATDPPPPWAFPVNPPGWQRWSGDDTVMHVPGSSAAYTWKQVM